MLYIVTGGSGSGKSEYAEQTAVQCRNRNGGTLWYLATMRIWDDEGRKRVERHRRMRAAKGFETIERYTGLETLELEERFEESNSAGLDDEQENDSLKRWDKNQCFSLNVCPTLSSMNFMLRKMVRKSGFCKE